jgi:translation elongation factor EF-Ts
VVEKIVDGKLDKFFGGVCLLLDQAFVKNPIDRSRNWSLRKSPNSAK